MPRRKQLSDADVLDAAMPAIFSAGPDAFTLSDVACAVGLAPATLIQRFGSKQGLVVAALELTNRRHFAALEQLPPDAGAEAVIRIFLERTPGPEHENLLPDQLLWLRESLRDPGINALSRQYFAEFRRAIAVRMPALPLPVEDAVRLLEAQWHGALVQWGISREGHLVDFVAKSLTDWFEIAGCFSDTAQEAKQRIRLPRPRGSEAVQRK